MPAGYTLSASDLQYQITRLGNYWKALLGATQAGLQRIVDVGSPAIIAAYQAGGSSTYIKDLVDLNAATTAMSNVIYYAGYVGVTSKTDNTGGAGLSNPTTGPTVTPQGPAGPTAGTTASYQVVYHTLNGTTTGYTGSPPNAVVGSTTAGWATLTTTNYNILTNYAVAGCTQYDIWKWTGAAWVLLGSTTASYFMDTGQAGSAGSVPTSNTTAGSAQTVSVPNGSFCVVTADASLIGVLKPVGTDQTPAIRAVSDLTQGTL